MEALFFLHVMPYLDVKFPQNKIFINYENDWTIVSHFAPKTTEGKLFNTTKKNILLHVIITNKKDFFLILIFSFILTIFIVNGKILKKELYIRAHYDGATFTLNRQAGVEFLQKEIRKANINKTELSVCFIDVNGLKSVNDTLGHEYGDELILTVANVIKKRLPTNDIVARFGGDEFVLVLTKSSKEKAEEVWSDITKDLLIINETENRKYVVSVSHGISTISEVSSTEALPIDYLIELADHRMYEEKRIEKQSIQIIR